MSYDRLTSHEARLIANELKIELAGQARRIETAGSTRRGKSTVKDIELVIIPHHRPSLLARIDAMVISDQIQPRANKKGNRIAWGQKERACVYKRIYPVDIFLADEDNFGFIYWLRTGPGDANTRVMEILKMRCSPVRARDGRLHWVHYPPDYNSHDDNYIPTHVISTPSEADVFTLFGMDYRPPARRSMANYIYQLTHSQHQWPDPDDLKHLMTALPGHATQSALF